MKKNYILLLLVAFSLTSYFIISCRHEPPAVLVNYVFTYGTWSACTNGAETRTYTSTPNGGTPPADSVSRTCTAPPTTCSFTYSVWSNCVSNLQIRTVTSTSPVGCTGIPPTDSLSRACSTSCPTINVSGTPASPKTNCSNDGTIVASASGGAAPYTYSKNGTTFQSSATFTALVIGTYTITVKDANLCQGTSTISVPAPTTVHFATDIKPTINSYCGRANVGCHSHSNSWTTYSDIVGTSTGTGTAWSSNLLTFLKRIQGTSNASPATSCPIRTTSGNHDMPPSTTTTWNTFIQGVFTNWVNQGNPNN